MPIKAITTNVLLQDAHNRLRAALQARFPEIGACPQSHFLALSKYITRIPHKFFSNAAYAKFLDWLKKRDSQDREAFKQYLATNEAELNRAFIHLEEINQLGWHDTFTQPDDYALIRFIDQKIHPSYIRLSEAVLRPLLHLPAYFSRTDQNKGTEGLDIFQIVSELKSSHLKELTDVYHHTVRNGIGHGGITYLQKEIRYRDKKGNEEKLSDSAVIRLFDDLLDTCNALTLGLSVFLLEYQQHGYKLLQQLLIDELKEETKAPWWEIIGCVPSEFSGINQLMVYARSLTFDERKVRLSAFHSGILAEYFAPGYNRYFVSIHSNKSWPGWAAFNGDKLRELRSKPDSSFEEYKGVLEDDIIFYVPHYRMPLIFSTLQNLYYSFKLRWPGLRADIRKQRGLSDIIVREANIHRNSWGCVLRGSVYVQPAVCEINKNVILKACRRIIRKTLAHARRHTSRLEISRYLPLGFAQINVFLKDHRRRRLASFGLGPDLIGTIRIQRISRIKSPNIRGSTIELKGRYRIAWNKAWLESIRTIAHTP